MNGVVRNPRFKVRPLLVASTGLALIAIGGCGGGTPSPPIYGNLMVIRCDGGYVPSGACAPDAGSSHGGT